MAISWKSLFVREEEDAAGKPALQKQEPVVFPSSMPPASATFAAPAVTFTSAPADKDVMEVLSIYEKGLESINMPGYDFYEFFCAVNAVGATSEPAYNMAYQMAKTMDRTITTQKLLTDAEFYISKINEVHSQYVTQGQEKLNALAGQQNAEKQKLTDDVNNTAAEIERLKSQLAVLENTLHEKKTALAQSDQLYKPQEATIRQKMRANDNAHQISIQRLNNVREGIRQYLQTKQL